MFVPTHIKRAVRVVLMCRLSRPRLRLRGSMTLATVSDATHKRTAPVCASAALSSSAHQTYASYESCELCPRRCHAKRNTGRAGFCGASNKLYIARAALHFWEEPPISGTAGSGAIFFTGCPLRCAFCQNFRISQEGFGKQITVLRLAEIMLELQEQGALNINLVTPLHYTPQVIQAVEMAKAAGLQLPIVCNTSGYLSLIHISEPTRRS